MATFQADIKTTPTGSIYSVTVEAGALYVARQEIERLYKPIFIRNLHQVSRNSSSSSGDSDSSSVGGAVALIGLIGAGWLLMSFTPYVLMTVYGAGATWISQLLTGQSIEEYAERNDDSGHGKAAIVLVLALLAGGFGFVQGSNLQKEWNTPDTPAQVKPASK